MLIRLVGNAERESQDMISDDKTKTRCVIIAAYQSAPRADLSDIGPRDLIVCADGGYAHAQACGVVPHAIIGDFDSLEHAPSSAGDAGVEVIRLDTDKDRTDTLECVRYGIGKGFEDFLIIGGLGGRLDHSIANIQTLSFLTDMGCRAWIVDGKNRAAMVAGAARNLAELSVKVDGPVVDALGCDFAEVCGVGTADAAQPGSICLEPIMPNGKFSVFSYEERSVGVCISGAKYHLTDAVLTQSYPIGVSNEFVGDSPVTISVTRGRLLIVLSED
ncbi:MAG: thiamine diphosphokinase [Clostridiales Family XIII bacterium]|jgi:thiamine pyrophosphokinase|nr:thiamine diphosphokinase [Clostridiales Family XIII bacterium]